MAIGCTTAPKVVTVPEIVKVPVDRYVEVPESLTQPVEISELPEREVFDTMSGEEKLITVSTLWLFQRVRAMQCNGQLNEISTLASD